MLQVQFHCSLRFHDNMSIYVCCVEHFFLKVNINIILKVLSDISNLCFFTPSNFFVKE